MIPPPPPLEGAEGSQKENRNEELKEGQKAH